MVVTSRALDCGAGEGLHDGRDHVVAVEVAANLPVNRVFPDVPQRTLVPRPGGNETKRDDGLRIVGKQHVARDLFLKETPVGLVAVERRDEVIAIRPGVGSNTVLVVSVRLGEMGRVHPVPRPAFTVARRREQPIHGMCVGIGR